MRHHEAGNAAIHEWSTDSSTTSTIELLRQAADWLEDNPDYTLTGIQSSIETELGTEYLTIFVQGMPGATSGSSPALALAAALNVELAELIAPLT